MERKIKEKQEESNGMREYEESEREKGRRVWEGGRKGRGERGKKQV